MTASSTVSSDMCQHQHEHRSMTKSRRSYSEVGFAMFPCQSPAQHPMCKGRTRKCSTLLAHAIQGKGDKK